jgi:hypothetical protein
MIPYRFVDECCIQVLNCQTTTGYIVKNHYYSTLISNFREGLSKLEKQPSQKSQFAIDKFWIQLQKKDKWYLIVPLTVVQHEDYSDIEKKVTNFVNWMLLKDKAIATLPVSSAS